jgi:MerR family transcriptional regulator, copper efflux regulator
VGRRGMHQIGEVADAVGLSLRTIRHYEEVGLVPPSGRTEGGFRLYSDPDVDRLRLVKQMKPLGFTLEEMADILGLLARAGDDADTGDTRDRLAMYASLAEERCTRLRDKLADAQQTATLLRRESEASVPPVRR